MAKIESILDELGREAKTTRRVLQRLPTDKLGWKPHPKSKSLGELGWHLATIPFRIASGAQTDDFDVLAVKAPPLPATTEEILTRYDEQMVEARARLATLDDDALARTMTMRAGLNTIFHGPRAQFLRSVMLNHSYHHRGQLTVYLRLLEVAVPPVYGPTADER